MLDCSVHRQDLKDRLSSARLLINAVHPGPSNPPGISREVRGLAIVLVYAAYENLLWTLCRSLLESAKATRAKNRRFRPGLRLFAASEKLHSMMDVGMKGIWRSSGRELIDLLLDSQNCTINPDIFPLDGSQMRRKQVQTICDLFDLGNPAPVLKEVWQEIDTVVIERNAIAHGRETADEVGRRYSESDLLQKIDLWETRWIDFLNWVEGQASKREFYLLPR
jgi:hypothetical protein